MIEYVSGVMTLETGDLILTGTPQGVGPVVNGDILKGSLMHCGKSIDEITFTAQDRE